jgi:hypothetical protein
MIKLSTYEVSDIKNLLQGRNGGSKLSRNADTDFPHPTKLLSLLSSFSCNNLVFKILYYGTLKNNLMANVTVKIWSIEQADMSLALETWNKNLNGVRPVVYRYILNVWRMAVTQQYWNKNIDRYIFFILKRYMFRPYTRPLSILKYIQFISRVSNLLVYAWWWPSIRPKHVAF